MKLSIVATLYQSAPHIAEFKHRMETSARSFVGDDYEILFVHDGSPDDSLGQAIAFSKSDNHIVVIDLSRNFGHHKAMMTGLAHAHGELVFLIDTDLEEDPEYLLPFAQHLDLENCDVVYGVQARRKGRWFERASGHWFYKLFRLFTGLNLPRDVVTARLMTRRYVNALLRHEEREIFLAGLWHITGFDQRPYAVKKHSTSKTTYTLRRKMSLLVNSITSFSNLPLIGIFYIGIFVLVLAAASTAYLLVQWAYFSRPLSGWTSVMVSIWLLGGMLISFIGVVGIYLSKVFSETKRRPYSIVREIYGRKNNVRSAA